MNDCLFLLLLYDSERQFQIVKFFRILFYTWQKSFTCGTCKLSVEQCNLFYWFEQLFTIHNRTEVLKSKFELTTLHIYFDVTCSFFDATRGTLRNFNFLRSYIIMQKMRWKLSASFISTQIKAGNVGKVYIIKYSRVLKFFILLP